MKLRLLGPIGISASVLLAVACGGASNSDLFAEPGTSSSPTDPSGSGTGESTSSSSGASSTSSSGATSSSSGGASSSSGGGSSSGGTSTSGGIAKDAGPGPTPVTSKIYCGGDPPTSCTAKTQVCCVYFHSDSEPDLSCESSGVANCIGGTTIACDDRTDCPTNQVCCGMLDQNGYSSVECKSTCQNAPGLKAVRFCDPDAAVNECPAGSYCGDSQSAPGYHVCRN